MTEAKVNLMGGENTIVQAMLGGRLPCNSLLLTPEVFMLRAVWLWNASQLAMVMLMTMTIPNRMTIMMTTMMVMMMMMMMMMVMMMMMMMVMMVVVVMMMMMKASARPFGVGPTGSPTAETNGRC